jgi:hypothetical protein
MHRLLLAALLLLAACTSELAPTAPGPVAETRLDPQWVVDVVPADESVRMDQGPSGRYPLQLGNEWKYRAHVTIHTMPDVGEPSEEEIVRTTKSEITGASAWLGRCYAIEERTITENGDRFTQFVHYRQDRAGLYEVAEATNGPTEGMESAFATTLREQRNPEAWSRAFEAVQVRVRALQSIRGGVLEGELTRLEYPLRQNQEWVVIDDAFFMSSRVEGRVLLDLPTGRTPAWKVRMESSLFGPDDDVCMFYGNDGYLGWQLSLVSEVTDELGERIGTVFFTDEEYLEELSIDRRGEVPCEPLRRGGKNEGGIESN